MHNHQRTQIIQNADYEFLLTIDVINQNPFKKAQIKIEFIDLKYHPADPKSSIMLIFDKKCFGISCSVKDFAQLIKKSFDHQHFTQVLKKI